MGEDSEGFARIHETLGEDSQGVTKLLESICKDSWNFGRGFCEDFVRGFTRICMRLWERGFVMIHETLGDDSQGFVRLLESICTRICKDS